MRYSLPAIGAVAVSLAAVLSLGACTPAPGSRDDVAAVVAGKPITVGDLEGEMRITGVSNLNDPRARRAALERMIDRKLMAHAADVAGITRAPDTLRLQAISRETFAASLARSATLAGVRAPTTAEAQAFVAQHPELFAQRTLYLVDRIQTAAPPGPAVLKALEPTKTLEEAAKVLDDNKITYRRAPVAVDALATPPAFAQILGKLPPGEVFVIPSGGGVSINRIKASETHPVTGDPAVAIAHQMLMNQRGAQALTSQMQDLRATVRYSPQFAPPARP